MEILEPEYYYHIFNHANGSENLFNCEENYNYFMKKYDLHISPVAETYSYCLMPNHFHILIRIKDESQLIRVFPKFKTLEKLEQNNFISKQFANFFSSYTQSFNKKYNRKGSLFIKNFQRKKIISEQYLKQAIVYVHQNPVHHKFAKNPEDWKYSSYNAFFSSKLTSIRKNEVINLFNDLQNFKDYHKTKTAEIYESKMGMTY
jgi:REP element-mobilizing transposase RayT